MKLYNLVLNELIPLCMHDFICTFAGGLNLINHQDQPVIRHIFVDERNLMTAVT